MAIGTGKSALWQPVNQAVMPQPGYSALPSAIPGLAGWWDAGTFAGLLGATGATLAGWNQAVGSIADKSGGGASMTPFSFTTPNGPPLGTPRLSGLLGGVGRFGSWQNSVTPPLDPDLGFQIPGSTISWTGAWTWYLVWSRPNWRLASGRDGNPVTLLSAGSVPVLQADSKGGDNRLILFPGPQQTIIAQNLNRRHTHSIMLRAQIGGGVSVWLDDERVALGAYSPAFSSMNAPILFFHDGTILGGAQCWFHEAACWQRALSDAEIDQLRSYAGRWYRGARRSVLLLIDGQSNAINYALNDGAAALLAKGVAWFLGALSFGIVATTGAATSYTMQSGHGIYSVSNGNYPGSFLLDPGDGSDPSTWSTGLDGQAVQQALAGLTTEDEADICAIVWPWNETDSLRSYSELDTFLKAAKRFLSLERAMLNRPATSLPLIWWNAIPYGTPGGMQMHRAVVASLAADPTQNIAIGNTQTSDSNARGASWDPTSGMASGGDSAHRDSLDNQRFARLAAPVVARILRSSGMTDSVESVPIGMPAAGGPRIVHAYRQSSTSVILTIQHDAGTDLKLPLQAGTGIGFAVMDGGSAASPGSIVNAVACARIDATHLGLTLARPLANLTAACSLYYPYAGTTIGRGNAVTDNYAACAKPEGWDIAADLGTAWQLDCPLAATFVPVPLSDTPQ